ncbi:nesprin-3 isoform X2 [Corythoichthys intestinalis]|uniref:nesprin-3 isoform X2 n=1 Tax=Corythoichthys intestinalis TaxID=161448 RepID=UPI0025A63618|nr:nesprin-3 isoform X2 [Corythoichthys intestinalis]
MTEQEQQTFIERLEEALSWMKAVQENLRENDNTQGPWNALEARLRETEKIHQSEHDGHVKMDMALVAAEHLLESGDEKLRNHTLAKLKDLKSFWEETCTYIIHCHSRIEWVWLHWSEYLKAHQEFVLWLTRQQLDLDVGVELQLGLKEKLWQVDQQRVVVSDVHGQKALLERLIDEAAVLHNRTQDPSLDSQAREKLLKTYSDIRDKVEERLSLLQEIAEEHQTYQGSVQRFQSWLLSKTKELTDLMEKEDTTENKLQALQVFDDIVGNEEKTLQYIESVAESVRAKTSPAGADVVVDEAEELRLGWQRLRQGIFEVEEGLQSTLYTHNEYTTRCKRLEQDIGRLQSRLQELNLELKEDCNVGDDTDSIDEQVDQWRNYMRVRKTLIGEESQVDHLKLQLKELFRFSEDSRHISDHVLDVVKEHQSVKCKATKLCSDSEACLRNMFQEKLVFFTQWRNTVSQILETSAEVMDFSHIVTLVQNTERLLKDSIQLQDRLNDLRTIEDLCDSLFGPEKSDGLRSELSTAIRDRELLHVQLIQRKARLQGLISRTNDFGDAYVVIRSKLTSLTDRMMAIERPQPDILAKKSQSDQFMVKLQESEERIADHSNFHDRLLNLQKWLMIMKQKLESFKSPKGEWSIESREHEAQRALGEFPEKEFQLQQMEMHGHRVLKNTSEEGRVHIVGDMKHLQESWLALYSMSLNIHRLLNGSIDEGQSVTTDMSVREVDGECTVHSEGQSILPGMQDEHPKLSGKGMGGHHSHAIDEYDLSTWTIQSKAGLPLAKESPEDTNPKTDISRAGDSYTLNTAKSSLVVSPEEGTMSPEEGAMAIEESQAIGKAMIFRDASAKLQAITSTQDKTMKADLYESRRRKFEAWLCKENKLLSSILSNQGAILKGKKLKMQQDTLSALWSRVTWGQEQFQLLLQENGVHKTRSGQAVNASLEELRYRWMLYKSKLKAVGGLGTTYSSKKPGLLQRVCRLALPLWILFLALLLLAFILPLVDEGNSCSISNNFARSFSVMLRYSGPPPT